MKISEIRKLDVDSLGTKLRDLEEEVFNLKMQAATQQLSNINQLYLKKRDIARIKTVMTEQSKKNVINDEKGNK